MSEHSEIVPGESIGPFRLGMSREEIERLGLGPRMDLEDGTGAHYPMVGAVEETVRPEVRWPRTGVTVYYDESGRCDRLAATFAYRPRPPIFRLCGRRVNGMTESEVVSILGSLARDISRSYGSIWSRSAGLRAIKWEAGDDHIVCIEVMPKGATARAATDTATPTRAAPEPASAASATETAGRTEAPKPTKTGKPSDPPDLPPIEMISGGGRIAFSSDREGCDEVSVVHADGSGLVQLTSNEAEHPSPARSPGGACIAFPSGRDGNLEICAMNVDGSGQTRLTYSGGSDTSRAWLP